MNENEKKYSRKRRYLKDFKPNDDGSFSYQGAVMHCTLTGEDYRKTITRMLLVAVLALALVFAAGCVRGTGMEGCFYLLLPYAGTLVILIRLVWNLIRLLYTGSDIREYVYKRTAERLPAQLLFGTILPAIALGGVIYGQIRGTNTGGGSGLIVFVISQIGAIIACQGIRILGRELAWLP